MIAATLSRRPTSGVAAARSCEIPYARHGDSLLVAADTSSAGGGEALFIGGEEPGAPQQIGAVVASDARLTLLIGAIPSSTGFSGSVSRFVFTPAR